MNSSNDLQISPKNPLCFIHLPKTGGTTLREFISRAFSDHKFGMAPQHASYKRRNVSIDEKNKATVFSGHYDYAYWEKQKINPQFITILRSPVERMVSLYYFWKSHSFEYIDDKWNGHPTAKFCKKRSFHEFVESEIPQIGQYMFNSQSRQLVSGLFELWKETDEELLSQVLTNLHTFRVVGLTNQLEMTMNWLSYTFDKNLQPIAQRVNSNQSLKNRFPKTYAAKPDSIPESVSNQIKKLNLVDIVVCEWVNDRWKDGSYSHSNDLEADISTALLRLKSLRSSLGVKTDFPLVTILRVKNQIDIERG